MSVIVSATLRAQHARIVPIEIQTYKAPCYVIGCRLFEGVAADGATEKGMYCYCLGENCNTGDINYPVKANATATTNTTTTTPSG